MQFTFDGAEKYLEATTALAKNVGSVRMKRLHATLKNSTMSLEMVAKGGNVPADATAAPAWHSSESSKTEVCAGKVEGFYKKTLHMAKVQDIENLTKAAIAARVGYLAQAAMLADIGGPAIDDELLAANSECIVAAKATKLECHRGRVFLKPGWEKDKTSSSLSM